MSYQQPPQQQQQQQQQQQHQHQPQQPQYGHPHQQQQQYGYLPAYQPPQPVPHQYHQHPQPTQPVHVSPKGMWVSKLTLRLISMIFSIVIIGLGASVFSDLNAVNNYYSDWYLDDGYGLVYTGPILFLGPPAAVAFIWSLAEAICICARGGHRGIHPGACVGVDLIIWLGFVGSATGVALALYWIFSPYLAYQYPLIAFVFGIIEAAIHFTLFVIACCETNIRNRRSTLVYVQSGPVHGNGNLPHTGAPPMTTPYATKDQPTTVTQPAVARKPLGLSPDPHSQWDQHHPLTADGFRTPETNTPPFHPPGSPEMQATYRPNERY